MQLDGCVCNSFLSIKTIIKKKFQVLLHIKRLWRVCNSLSPPFHHISQVPSMPSPNLDASNSPPNPNPPSSDLPSLPSAKPDACGGEARQGGDMRGSPSLNSTASTPPSPDPDPQPQTRRRQPATHHHLIPTPVAQPAHRLAPTPPTSNSDAQSKTNASSSPPTASHHRRMPTPQTPS